MATTPHKHAEVIKAWADGKQIQFKRYWDTEYYDCSSNPQWQAAIAYRVKPEETIRYRVCLFRSVLYDAHPFTVCTYSSSEAEEWEKNKTFVRWLTPWTEVEV